MQLGALISGKYRLTRQIGEGTMAVVWAAVNEATSREVALKLILRSTEELRQRLEQEARSAGGLKHRNIIEIVDVGRTSQGDPYLVMPLLTGETLSDLLERKRRLEPDVAAWIARDVARALETAHAGNIVHRDLKPDNIFLHREPGDERPIVKVLDFGISKNLEVASGLTVAGKTLGSPAYMSPEQTRMDLTLDHRADLWSLGVVLFEMLTGVRPFNAPGNQVIPLILSGDIPRASRFIRHVEPGLDALVARCLERDLDKRIGSATELAAELERFMIPNQQAPAFARALPDPVVPIAPIAAPASAPSPVPAPAQPPFGPTPPAAPSSRPLRLDELSAEDPDGAEVDDDAFTLTMKLQPKTTVPLVSPPAPPIAPPLRAEPSSPPVVGFGAPAAHGDHAPDVRQTASRHRAAPGPITFGVPPVAPTMMVSGTEPLALAREAIEFPLPEAPPPTPAPQLSPNGSSLEAMPRGGTIRMRHDQPAGRPQIGVLGPSGPPPTSPVERHVVDLAPLSDAAPMDALEAKARRKRVWIAVVCGVWLGTAGLVGLIALIGSPWSAAPSAAAAVQESTARAARTTLTAPTAPTMSAAPTAPATSASAPPRSPAPPKASGDPQPPLAPPQPRPSGSAKAVSPSKSSSSGSRPAQKSKIVLPPF